MRPAALGETARRPVSALGRFGWAMFDWSNQPYFTLVTTFIFAPYFTSTVIGDTTRGQSVWGYAQAVAGVIIAFGSPVLGAIADAHGPKKPWIFAFQAIFVAACFALWWAVPGDASVVLPMLTAIVVASVAAEFSIVFNNAMLPSVAREGRLGRLSGQAWALGYVGGLVSLILVLFAFSLPEAPLLGLDKASHEDDRIVGPLTGVWIAIFVLPLFLFTPDMPPRGLGVGRATREGLRRFARTVADAGRYGNLARYLIARMLYFDGLTAIFAFGGIYAAGSFGWRAQDLGVFGIILSVFAAVGAFAGGWLDDRFGSKRTILIALIGVLFASLGVVSIAVEPGAAGAERHTLLFFWSYDWRPPANSAFFASPAEKVFLVFGIAIGIFGGPLQAASRTMLSRLSPPGMVAEFYGLYALSGKATAFFAPFAIAVATETFASRRVGVATVLLFLLTGLALMRGVREERAGAPV
ncbi:MAG TPA: MFS transporter, partial [Alphaproteobacteria bacterium]|nr:MFS transporter [Alphaproteobacteria bacterium]